ncbi:hypothetical protein U1Q18_019210 [Sarracenia purpurea var. burkii]
MKSSEILEINSEVSSAMMKHGKLEALLLDTDHGEVEDNGFPNVGHIGLGSERFVDNLWVKFETKLGFQSVTVLAMKLEMGHGRVTEAFGLANRNGQVYGEQRSTLNSCDPSKPNPQLMRTQNREQNRDRPLTHVVIIMRLETNGRDRPSGRDISCDHHANRPSKRLDRSKPRDLEHP